MWGGIRFASCDVDGFALHLAGRLDGLGCARMNRVQLLTMYAADRSGIVRGAVGM